MKNNHNGTTHCYHEPTLNKQTVQVIFAQSLQHLHMVTNSQIDEELIQDARRLSGIVPSAIVEEALRECVQRHKQRKIMELFDTIEYDEDHDYKKQRKSK